MNPSPTAPVDAPAAMARTTLSTSWSSTYTVMTSLCVTIIS